MNTTITTTNQPLVHQVIVGEDGRKHMIPLNREQFMAIRTSPSTMQLLENARQGDKTAKMKLPQFNYSVVPNEDGTLKGATLLKPTFGMDIDFALPDDTLAARIMLKNYADKIVSHAAATNMTMLEQSPTKGYHAVFVRDWQLTQEENLRRVSEILGVDYDKCAKDSTRVFFGAGKPIFDDGRLWNGTLLCQPREDIKKVNTTQKAAANTQPADNLQTTFKGIPLANFAIEWLTNVHGGMPQEGERNQTLYRLAQAMKHICDNRYEVIANAIPHCGLSDAEVLALCRSACETISGSMSKEFRQIVDRLTAQPTDDENDDIADETDETDETNDYPQLPPLPSGIREFADIAPARFKNAILPACLPLWGTLLSRLRALYIDNILMSPSFQTILVGEQASGKSMVRIPADLLLNRLIDEDNEVRIQIHEWQEWMEKNKNSKQLREKPKGIIRFVPASTTNSRLFELAYNSQPLHMITVCEEIDELSEYMGREGLTHILRRAYDNALCGRECKTAEATSAMVKMYWNLLLCGTEKSVRKFFKNNPEDGSVSRTIFIPVRQNIGDDMPIWKMLSKSDRQKLQKLVDKAMRLCRDENGNVMKEKEMDMEYLNNAMRQWLDQQTKLSVEQVSKSRDVYKKRAAVNGFRAGMVADWLWRTTQPKMKAEEREKNVIAFARFIADQCVENLIDIFPLQQQRTIWKGKTDKQSRSLFNNLPDTFNFEDVERTKNKFSLFGSPYDIVRLWKKKGMITKINKNSFKKA